MAARKEGNSDMERDKTEIGLKAVQAYLPVVKPDSSDGISDPPWHADGEFTVCTAGYKMCASLTNVPSGKNKYRELQSVPPMAHN